MSDFKISIAIDETSLDTMQKGGYKFFGFKAAGTAGEGLPVVWFATTKYMKTVNVKWSQNYRTYVSFPASSGDVIESYNDFATPLSKKVNIVDATGKGNVVDGKLLRGIQFHNQSTSPFTVGLMEKPEGVGDFAPLCALTAHGGHQTDVYPVEKVLLVFATSLIDQGAVQSQSFGKGVLIDMTGAVEGIRTLSYQIDKSWGDKNGPWDEKNKQPPWATIVGPDDDLAKHLIEKAPEKLTGLSESTSQLVVTGGE